MSISPPSTSRVPRRRFGRTGLAMPVFSTGGMRYQHSWKDADAEGISAEGQANLEACIRRSLEAGICHIETARGYGTSELQLGRILPSLPRDEIIVQTKGGAKEDPAEFRKALETSFANLRLDHIDLFAFHGVNHGPTLDLVVRDGGCLEVVREFQKAGRIRFVGFSTHGPCEDIVRAIGTGVFDYVNVHWYYVYHPVNWPAVEAAAQRDMGVFIISPNDKGGKLYEAPDSLRELCHPLTPMQFNDLWCLSRPEVHTLSLGAAKPSDYDEHLEGLRHWDDRERLTGEIARRLEDRITERLGRDWAEGWWEGIPHHERCPNGINIVEILRLYTFAKGLDMVAFGKMRYNLLGNGGHWFPGMKAGEVDADAVRACVAASPVADRIPEALREAHALLHSEPVKRQSQS